MPAKRTKQVVPIRIAFLDVGQGDTIVVTAPQMQEAIVIDCIDEKAVLTYLKQENIKRLRAIIITHLHEDHYSRALKLFNNLPQFGISECERLCFNPLPIKNRQLLDLLLRDKDEHSLDGLNDSKARKTAYQNLLEAKQRHKPKFRRIFEQEDYPLPIEGALAQQIRVMHPHSSDYDSLLGQGLNNTSVVLHITTNKLSTLLMGDLEPSGFQVLQANHPELRSNVLKFPHHGGAWTRDEAIHLLSQTQPSLVVISVGTTSKGGQYQDSSNHYGHPTTGVFEALREWSKVQNPFRLLCTQATSQCKSALLDLYQRVIVRETLISRHLTEAKNRGQTMIGSKEGCPCAGTVIIELSDQVRVIQPTPQFHLNIITSQFKDSRTDHHQCHIH